MATSAATGPRPASALPETHKATTLFGTSIAQAASKMLEKGTRHLPVIENGKLIGMLSARDLLSIVAG